jgi:hypothetical protein
METRDWITIGVAASSIINGWFQFWVKERLLTSTTTKSDTVLAWFRSRNGIAFITFFTLASVVGVVFLLREVFSPSPVTRVSCFIISMLTFVSLANVFLLHSLVLLRRLSKLKAEIESAKAQAIGIAIALS